MPTPRKGYFTKSGEKVPGTTTIIGRFKNSGALIYWAYKRGKDGLELYDSRDKAAEIGTVVHDMVERFIALEDPMKALEALKEEDHKAALNAFNAFDDWFEMNQFKVVAQEVQLVSDIHRYGGTPDAIAEDSKGRLVLLDWKTSSSGVFVDYLLQLGAYRILWNEANPNNQLSGGSHLCVFSKAHGDFSHHHYPNLDEAEEYFLHLRMAYELDSTLSKRAK